MSYGYGKFATTIAILASAVIVTPQTVLADEQANADKQPASPSITQQAAPVTGHPSLKILPRAVAPAQSLLADNETSAVPHHSVRATGSSKPPSPAPERSQSMSAPSPAPERSQSSAAPSPAPDRSTSSASPSPVPARTPNSGQEPERSPSPERNQAAENSGPQLSPERKNSQPVTTPTHKRAAATAPTAPQAVPLETLLKNAAPVTKHHPDYHHGNNLAMVADINNRAFEMIDAGDFKGAIRHLDNAISIQSEDFLYRSRGYAYLRAGNLDMARLDYLQAIRLNPSNSTSWCNLAFIYANQGNVKHALSALDRSISLNPSNAMALATKGHLLQVGGDKETARKCLDQAIAADPNCALAWNNRAVLKLSTSDKAGALSDIRAASQLEPSNSQYQQNLQFISKYTDGSKLSLSDGSAFQQRTQPVQVADHR